MYSCKLNDISDIHTQLEIFNWLNTTVGKSPDYWKLRELNYIDFKDYESMIEFKLRFAFSGTF